MPSSIIKSVNLFKYHVTEMSTEPSISWSKIMVNINDRKWHPSAIAHRLRKCLAKK